MGVDLGKRFQSYRTRSDISRQESDGQPLIHQLTSAAETSAVGTKATASSGIRDVFRKPMRSGPYILLDDKSGADPVSPISTQNELQRNGVLAWIARNKLFLGALLPLFSVLFELTMLSLFLYIYLSLPMDPVTGTRQRISPQYSIWPFISCVGSTKLAVFRALSFAIVVCSLMAVSLLFYLNHNVEPGYWLRRLLLLITTTANAFLIWLVFASEDNKTHLHLYIVAIRLLLLFAAKCTAWLIAYAMRVAYPLLREDPAAKTSFRCKMVLMPFALIMATLANAGVFTCKDPAEIQEKGTACYNLVAAAAISDWLYSIVNTAFLTVMAYDLYYDEHYGKAGKGEPTPRPSWEPRRVYVSSI